MKIRSLISCLAITGATLVFGDFDSVWHHPMDPEGRTGNLAYRNVRPWGAFITEEKIVRDLRLSRDQSRDVHRLIDLTVNQANAILRPPETYLREFSSPSWPLDRLLSDYQGGLSRIFNREQSESYHRQWTGYLASHQEWRRWELDALRKAADHLQTDRDQRRDMRNLDGRAKNDANAAFDFYRRSSHSPYSAGELGRRIDEIARNYREDLRRILRPEQLVLLETKIRELTRDDQADHQLWIAWYRSLR